MYTLYISEKEENDKAVLQLMKEKEGEHGALRMFWFCYTAPYETFEEIKKLQRLSAYRPFLDSNAEKNIIAIELKEWIGHEEEEYFKTFLKFLHDSPLDFPYEYIFTVRNATYEKAESMHKLLQMYLGEGEVRSCEDGLRLL